MEKANETPKAPVIEDVFIDGDTVIVIIDSPGAFLGVDLCFETKEDYEKFRAELKPYDQLKEEAKTEYEIYVNKAKEIVAQKGGEEERKTSKS